MVWNVKVAVEWGKLLELNLVDYRTLLVRQRQLQRPGLLASKILDMPLYAPLRRIVICNIILLWLRLPVYGLSTFHERTSIAGNRTQRIYVLPVLHVL